MTTILDEVITDHGTYRICCTPRGNDRPEVSIEYAPYSDEMKRAFYQDRTTDKESEPVTTTAEDRRIYNNFRPEYQLVPSLAIHNLEPSKAIKVGAATSCGGKTYVLAGAATSKMLLVQQEFVLGEEPPGGGSFRDYS